jgi:hypothetical protein
MNLLHDLPLLRLWRRLAAGRRPAPAFTVTVPAPLASAEVIELRRPAQPVAPSPLPQVVNG